MTCLEASAVPVPAKPATGAKLRLAYLCTQYPAVSHTFVRREIRELERRGHTVVRLSIRPASADLVDPLDREEAAHTHACLALPAYLLLVSALRVMFGRPVRSVRAVRLAWQMARRSERGLIRHLAYVIEAAALLPVVKRERIQHLHVHFGTNSAAVARLLYRLGGPAYSMTVHGPDEFDAPVGFDLKGKIHDAAFVAAISSYCAAQLYRWADPEDWPKIVIVPCSIDGEHLGAPKAIKEDSRALVTVGRFNAQKGQMLLLEAASRLRDQGIRFRLLFIGDGELRPLLERKIEREELGDCVTLCGSQPGDEVRRYLDESRALVLPSFAEGLPVVIMEAFAAGRPVIATSIAGIPELVRDGVNGWLIPAGDVDGVVDAMKSALSASVTELMEMGAAGRSAVQARHDVRSTVDRLEAQLRRTLAPERDN